jgi:hypothetical protein
MPLQNTGTNGRGKSFDPTRMSEKDEFKSEVLRVVVDMLGTINDSDMFIANKYDVLELDVHNLFELCMEG